MNRNQAARLGLTERARILRQRSEQVGKLPIYQQAGAAAGMLDDAMALIFDLAQAIERSAQQEGAKDAEASQ